MTNDLYVSVAVEGELDEGVARRLLSAIDAKLIGPFGKRGKHNLLTRLGGFNQAARRDPWLVIVDLDRDSPCAGEFIANVLPNPSDNMMLRVAVREVESWLLADGEYLCKFLKVSTSRAVDQPDSLSDPKQTLINIARSSQSRSVRDGIVPTPAGGRTEGPAYNLIIGDFIRDIWSPERARKGSQSLDRCLMRLAQLRS